MTRTLLILTPEFKNSHQETLFNAKEEAENMKETLISVGYNCEMLSSKITFDDLQTELYTRLNKSNYDDYLVLYISSHGSHSASTVFMAHKAEDTVISMYKKDGSFNASGLQLGLNEKFGAVSLVPGNLCIIYDVCQAGTENIINTHKVPCSFLRIAACSSKQSSKERVFTVRFRDYVINHWTDWLDDEGEEERLKKLFEGLKETPEVLSFSTSSRNNNLMKEFFESKEPKTKRTTKTKRVNSTWNWGLLAGGAVVIAGICFIVLRNK